jgi:hypothetical protein
MNVMMSIPAAAGGPALVTLQELGPVSLNVDPLRIGNEVLGHTDNLVTDTAHPVTMVLRFSQTDVMATPLDQVQVAHTLDSGKTWAVPDCVSGALVLAQTTCVLRPASRDAKNTWVTVLTTQTSRWHVRRDAPVELVSPPTPPPGLKVSKAKPDSSALKVGWSKVTGDAAAAKYQVYLDGQLKKRVGASTTSVVLKNPGVGRHKVSVVGVNALGEGQQATTKFKTLPMTAPRKTVGVSGAGGAPLTAGLTWRPPTESGGSKILGYRVVAYRVGAGKVGQLKVKATARAATFTLPAGRYQFKVRAVSAVVAGPWSPLTVAVPAR